MFLVLAGSLSSLVWAQKDLRLTVSVIANGLIKQQLVNASEDKSIQTGSFGVRIKDDEKLVLNTAGELKALITIASSVDTTGAGFGSVPLNSVYGPER